VMIRFQSVRRSTRRESWTFCGCGREVYIIALTYLDRLFQKHPDFAFSHGDVNRWLLTSVTLAIKWREEVCDQYPDELYAIIGGVTLDELCLLQSRLLVLLSWELHVNPIHFFKHCFLTAVLRTKATQFGNASSCLTSPGSSPADSEDEGREEEDEDDAVGVLSDDADEDECFPGRPLWGTHSFKTCANGVQYGEEADVLSDDLVDEDECLPGRPLWGTRSFKTLANGVQYCEEAEVWSDDLVDDECLPGRPLWGTNSFKTMCN